jgi:hypothetical protein
MVGSGSSSIRISRLRRIKMLPAVDNPDATVNFFSGPRIQPVICDGCDQQRECRRL